MTTSELKAIDFLLSTNKYKLTYKMVKEEEVPEEFHEGYKQYYKFKIEDNKKEEVASCYVQYGAIPTELENFFMKKHGNKLYYEPQNC